MRAREHATKRKARKIFRASSASNAPLLTYVPEIQARQKVGTLRAGESLARRYPISSS